ncbi:MAG: hypothetical protein O9333_03975 [Beijerinckiaceae bacterium]|jgi:hypothetical protein|nr:hypothetical protein [Beijerinckiaceae bacterium]
MTRSSPMILAALFAAILGLYGLNPARAAGIPSAPALALDAQSKAQTSPVYHHRRHYRPYRHVYRRHHYRPYYYHPAPVYHRRCVTRPRVVWTPYGYVRRWVRVCRY